MPAQEEVALADSALAWVLCALSLDGEGSG